MEKAVVIRKDYRKPEVKQLTPEQAKLKLLWGSAEGDEGANDLLRLLYPDALRTGSEKEI